MLNDLNVACCLRGKVLVNYQLIQKAQLKYLATVMCFLLEMREVGYANGTNTRLVYVHEKNGDYVVAGISI